MKGLFTIILIQFVVAVSFAQVETAERIEFELKEGYASHQLSKFKENGILFYSKSTDKKGSIRQWKIEQYSNNLKLKNTEFLEIPKDQFLDEEFSNETDLFLYFSSKKGAFTFYRINAKALKITKIVGELPSKANVNEIHVLKNMVYFDATMKRSPMLYTLDLESERQKLIPVIVSGYDTKDLSIEDVQVIEDANEVLVYINAFNKKEHDLHVVRFDEDGDKKGNFNITEGKDKKLSSISASYLGDGKYVYTGTYSSKSASTSEGIYIATTNNDDLKFIRFYNFLDFDKFLTYLPEKKQEKIEKKKSRKASKGKEMKINYLMASHDIIEMEDKYLYVGEAFYPTYRTEVYTTYVNGRPMTSTRRVFDGYQYTHAVVAGFNPDGEKLWDNTFEMWPSYKPFFKKKFITSSVQNDKKLDLLFSSGSDIKFKTFHSNGEVAEEEDFSFIDTGNEADKVKGTYSNMEHWYDKYFIAHGQQKIKNKEEKGADRKRRVYFINKVAYR
ncbi:MAG: hypothetical protein P1U41_09150 [Vicingaceae bacterium]|nr:hypothetical protein [Vicingaceae bacterium]